MEKCKFCDCMKGDIAEDLITITANFGIAGNVSVLTGILQSPKGKYFLLSGVVGKSTRSIEKQVEIHYCPICGRKLG